MPPVSALSDENSNFGDYPPLTDQDVGILYQIITSAEQSAEVGSLPFRAIFTAYDRVLAQNGLDPDHDQVYLRFLLRLGDAKVPEQSLYERFEALLAELGLQIEIHTGEDGDQQITRNLSVNDGVGFNSSLQSKGSDPPRKDRRRASFHSLYDTENGNAKSQTARPPSRASSSQYPFGKDVRDHHTPTRASIRTSGRAPQRSTRSQSSTAQPGRGRLTAQEFTNNLQRYQRRNGSATNNWLSGVHNHVLPDVDLVNQAEQAYTARLKRQSSHTSGSKLAEGEPPGGSQSHQTSYSLRHQELLYRPSETQLLRDADTFEHYRIKALTRDIISKWGALAIQAEKDRREMEVFATNHDAGILLQQGFDHWRTRLHEKKRIAETNRFFNRLELRASRARDLFLLTKAFTHWAECASEEVLRTSKARHHILRLKYFNAWRDITVVNELKVRRRGLHKFFNIWKQRCVQNLTDQAIAVTYHHEKLVKTAYWGWFWTFCEKRAPEWRAAQLKTKYFRIWLAKHQQISQREKRVTISLRDESKRSVFLRWLQKSRTVLSISHKAASFDHQRILVNSLNEWRLARQHAPLAQEVSNMVDWRVAGTTFATFVARFRAERRAEEVNRLRMMRNFWTQWNDRLRWQTLCQKIDDRFILESLYKWVIAERARLLQRLVAQRLKQRTLSVISGRVLATRARRFQSLQRFERSHSLQLVRSATVIWRNRLESHREDERVALGFYHPRIARESLQVWNNKHLHLRQLEAWAIDSEFYFLGTKILKRWQAAVVESKRNKLRDAYGQTRRKLKMKLATKIIRRWQGLTATLADLDQQAQAINQGRLLQIGSSLFDSWRSKYEAVVDQNYKAKEHFQQRFVTVHLHAWRDKFRAQQDVQERAEQFAGLRIEKDAFRWLQKLRLQMIEFQGRARNAESLRALHEKRHMHNIVRYWSSKTAARRGLPQREPARSSRPKRFSLRAAAEEDFTASARAPEEWTELEEGFDENNLGDWIPTPIEAEFNSTPLPAYLNTPSKRAVRIRPLGGSTSTTTPAGTPLQQRTALAPPLLPKTPVAIFQRGAAAAPLITPFQRRLRTQQPYTEPRVTNRPSALGRSVAGGTFGAIVEDEPGTLGGEGGE